MGNEIQAAAAQTLTDPVLEREAVVCNCEKVGDESEDSITLLSFNVPTKGDDFFRDAWNFRRRGLADIIRLHGAQIACVQENHAKHAEDVAGELGPDWSYFGFGRDPDGSDEFQPIFWQDSEFFLHDKGVFWLSATPDVPGSSSWGSACRRHCVFVKLHSRRRDDLKLLIANTHWDHVSDEARTNSGLLLSEKLAELGADYSIVVSGDFNCPPNAPGMRALVESGVMRLAIDSDNLLRLNSKDDVQRATFCGFGGQFALELDYILCSEDLNCQEYRIIDDTFESGRRLSDHRPILVRFRADTTQERITRLCLALKPMIARHFSATTEDHGLK